MEFLKVNGVVVNVVDSRRDVIRVGGGLVRSDGGAVRSSETATYYEHRFRTGPLSKDASVIVRGLVSGDGHTINFNSTTTSESWKWSSRAMVPYHASGTLDSGGRFGNGCLSATTTGTGLRYDLGGVDVTVMGWVKFGGTWTHVLKTNVLSSETTYVNGVASMIPSVATDAIVNSGGAIHLIAPSSAGGATVLWDEIAVLPYAVTAEVAAQLYVFSASTAIPPLPVLYVSGARFDGYDKMRGEVGTIDTVGHVVNGQWNPAGDAFDFVLMETP